MTTMEIAELQALVKVVQTGSFTRAADALGIEKARVSRMLSGLESKLGVRLLERTTRALSLTEVGREIFERAVGILAAVDDVARVSQRMLATPRGQLRLSCGVEFGMLAVSNWIEGYLQKYPEVSVEADFTGRLVDIVHEGFDLAIRVGELSDSALAARRLGELHYGLYASPSYLARYGLPGSPDALQSHQLLMFSAGSHRSGWRLRHMGEEVRVQNTARLRINNSFAVRDAALAGLGIAQLPLLISQECEVLGQLRRVLPEWQAAPVPVHALYPSNRYLTPKVRAFIDHAVEAFGGSGRVAG